MKPSPLLLTTLLTIALLAAPLATEAQAPGRIPRIGYALARVASEDQHLWAAARQGLRELGYVEGKNIALEVRWADGHYERFPELVAELLDLKIDVLVVATTPGALAAKKATRTIPIVVVATGDAVAGGLVTSLAHPGGNLTGLSLQNPAVHGKRLELLKESFPGISRVAVLTNPGNPIHTVFWNETQAAARTLGLQLMPFKVQMVEDFDHALAAATQRRAQALLAFDDSLTVAHRARLVRLAAQRRLPAMYGFRDFPEAGGLLSYGANLSDQYRRTAMFVDKILKGAKPADLPVEQPTKFELVINAKTAKALGVVIPPSVLARADGIIER